MTETIFVKFEYEPLTSLLPPPSLLVSQASLNSPGIRVLSASLFDPTSEDLGSGLLSDTIDAYEDSDRAEDENLSQMITNLQSLIDLRNTRISTLTSSLSSICSLDPKTIGMVSYIAQINQICKSALEQSE